MTENLKIATDNLHGGISLVFKANNVPRWVIPEEFLFSYGQSYIIREVNFNHVNINGFTFSKSFLSNYYIWTYFYTPQETRSLKLKKIGVMVSRGESCQVSQVF